MPLAVLSPRTVETLIRPRVNETHVDLSYCSNEWESGDFYILYYSIRTLRSLIREHIPDFEFQYNAFAPDITQELIDQIPLTGESTTLPVRAAVCKLLNEWYEEWFDTQLASLGAYVDVQAQANALLEDFRRRRVNEQESACHDCTVADELSEECFDHCQTLRRELHQRIGMYFSCNTDGIPAYWDNYCVFNGGATNLVETPARMRQPQMSFPERGMLLFSPLDVVPTRAWNAAGVEPEYV